MTFISFMIIDLIYLQFNVRLICIKRQNLGRKMKEEGKTQMRYKFVYMGYFKNHTILYELSISCKKLSLDVKQ